MNAYQDYKSLLSRLADVNYSAALLQWDQEVYMPEAGSAKRAQQLATLSGIIHEMATDKSLKQLLDKLSNENLDFIPKRNIELSLKDYNDRVKYPKAFVEELSRAISSAFVSWQDAKRKSDFSSYAPALEKLMDLKRQEAEILGYEKHPYDAMINQYEPGTTTADVDKLFEKVKLTLVPFTKSIIAQKKSDDHFMFLYYDKQKQWDFGMDLLRQMQYDFSAGRQDMAEHPFTIHFGCKDVRVTTRIDENNLHEMIWSTIHEGGHALYEQGLLEENYGLPAGEACSLAIHESQSRLWENVIGRGKVYWQQNYPKLQALFPENLQSVSLDAFYAAMNKVQPGLIRTNADELTYHSHILIRFEIEKLIMANEVKIKDLPELWNSKYKAYLGVDVPNDAQGVLQDVHWSHGSIGYFPTYSLGSFYAAQFYAAMKKDLPHLENDIAKGDFKESLNWLRTKIHQHGRIYTAKELIQQATGEEPNLKFFMDYAKEKYFNFI